MQNKPHQGEDARPMSQEQYSKELKEEFESICELINSFTEKANPVGGRFEIKASIDRFGKRFSAELYFPVVKVIHEFLPEIDNF